MKTRKSIVAHKNAERAANEIREKRIKAFGSDSTVALYLALFMFGVGLSFALNASYDDFKVYLNNRGHWESVEGVVLSSSLQEKSYVHGVENVRLFRPYISYKYQVGGNYYTGDRIAISSAWMHSKEDEDSARKIVSETPPQSMIIVHYLKSSPQVSSLSREGSESVGISFLFACAISTLLILAFLVIVYHDIRLRR